MSSEPPATAASVPRVGLIGLGRMGAPMAASIRRAGLTLAVHDRVAAVTDEVAAATGARPCASVAELASVSDVVVTMLPNGSAVRSVVLGEGDGGVVAELAAGGLVVDMSSASPGETRALGATLAAQGVALVDAPVSGGVERARSGQLAVMVGGTDADVERALPIFEAVGETVLRCGALGCGHAAKALNNAVSSAGLIAAGEALLVGQRHGVAPEILVDVLNASTGRNNATERKLRQFVLSRTFASGFELDLMVKDLRIALSMAVDAEVAPGLTAQSLIAAGGAQACLDPGADHTSVIQWLERQAGTELEGSAPETSQPAVR